MVVFTNKVSSEQNNMTAQMVQVPVKPHNLLVKPNALFYNIRSIFDVDFNETIFCKLLATWEAYPTYYSRSFSTSHTVQDVFLC